MAALLRLGLLGLSLTLACSNRSKSPTTVGLDASTFRPSDAGRRDGGRGMARDASSNDAAARDAAVRDAGADAAQSPAARQTVTFRVQNTGSSPRYVVSEAMGCVAFDIREEDANEVVATAVAQPCGPCMACPSPARRVFERCASSSLESPRS